MIISTFLLWLAIKYDAPWWVYIPLAVYIITWLIAFGIKVKEAIEILIFKYEIKHLK